MYEQILKTVVAFNNLPETDEIKEVKRQYLNYEISAFDFFCIADSYLDDQPCLAEHPL